MRLKVDLEIPQWTKWLAGGIAIGLALGQGAWRVYAEVPNSFKAGDTLSAQKLNDNFASLDSRASTLEQRPTSAFYAAGVGVSAGSYAIAWQDGKGGNSWLTSIQKNAVGDITLNTSAAIDYFGVPHCWFAFVNHACATATLISGGGGGRYVLWNCSTSPATMADPEGFTVFCF
jgi:hypothetical protein